MKRLFLMMALAVSLTAWAGDGDTKAQKKDKPEHGDFDLGVGVALPTNVPDGLSFAPFKSWEIYFGTRYCYTPKNALQTYSAGLWVDWRHYGLSTDRMFAIADGVVGLASYPAGASDKRSDIHIFSLSVPLQFTQQLGRQSGWKVTLGPVVNFNVYGRVGNSFELGDDEVDINTKGLKYRPVTIDLMANVQYKNIGVYCKYSPMSVLKSDKGPQFHSLTFGVCL